MTENCVQIDHFLGSFGVQSIWIGINFLFSDTRWNYLHTELHQPKGSTTAESRLVLSYTVQPSLLFSDTEKTWKDLISSLCVL
jgi:hypothetical protein